MSKGFSTLEILVGGTLLAIVMGGLLKFGNLLNKQQLQSSTTFQISQVSRLFVNAVQNGAAWDKTLHDATNGNMACLVNETDCTGQGGMIQVDDVTGTALMGYGGTSPTAGFGSDGQPCNQFAEPPAPGNDSCPYRVEVKWEPICPPSGTPCVNPQVKVVGSWKHNAATAKRTIAFNGANYGFSITQGVVAPNTYVRYSADGTQSVAYDTYVPVVFSQKSYDNLGEFDGTRFRPKQTGVYQVSYNLSYGPTSWNFGGCVGTIVVEDSSGTVTSGQGVSASYPTQGPTNLCTATGSHSLHLSAGERLFIQTHHTWGAGAVPGPQNVTGAGYTVLTISRLQ